MHRIVDSIQQKAAVQTTGLAAKQSDTDIPGGRIMVHLKRLQAEMEKRCPSIDISGFVVYALRQTNIPNNHTCIHHSQESCTAQTKGQ